MFIEKSLEKIGWRNKYIIVWFFTISMIKTWPGLFGLYSFQFTSSKPKDYHCRIKFGGKELALPYKKVGGIKVYDKCKEYPDFNNRNVTRNCGNGYTYTMGAIKTSVITDYNLVCDRHYLKVLKDISLLAFVFVGSIVNALFSDKYGRRKILLITFTGCNAVSLLLTFTMNIYYFIFFQIFAGIFQEASYATGFTLMLEYFSSKYRAYACLVNSLMWTAGGFLLCFYAFILKNVNYRYLYLLVALSMQLPFLYVYKYLPESLRWLYSNNMIEEAKSKLVEIGNYSDPPITKEMIEEIYEMTKNIKVDENIPIYYINDILKSRILTKYFCLNLLLWFTGGMTYYAIQIRVVENSDNIFLNFMLTFLCDVPANMCVYYISNKLGRKKIEMLCTCFVVLMIFSAFMCVLFLRPDNRWPSNACLMFAKLANAGFFNIIFMHTAEIFPTTLRSTTIGCGSALGRVGAAIGVALSVLPGISNSAPFVGMIIFNLLTLVSIYILPETHNRELPISIKDAEEI